MARTTKITYLHADGAWRVLEAVCGNRIVDPAIGGIVGTSRDMTARVEAVEAEDAPRVDEARYRLLAENATDLIARHTPEGVYLYASPACERLLGYTPDELLTLPAYAWVHPDDIPAVAAAHATALAGDETGTVTYRARRKDGRYTWFETTSRAIRDPETGGVEIQCASRDIDARKRAEDALDTERCFLRAVLDTVEAGIVACDADGRLSIFNRASRAFHGLPEEPLPPDQWAGRYDLYAANGHTPLRMDEVPLFRALRGEQVRDAEMVIAPGGGAARTLLANGRAIQDGAGRPLGAVVAMHDITERKRVEEELRLSEERFAAFMDHMPAVAYMKDERGRFAYINAAFERLFAVRPEAIYGTTDDAWFTSEVAAQNRANDRAVLDGGRPLEALETVPTPDGARRHWMSYKFPVRTAAGTLLGGVSIDVTERQRLQGELEANRRELERSNAELRQFAYVASHDLQEPLRTVTSYLKLLQRRYRGKVLDETADEYMAFATDGATRMSDLIKAVLDYSRVGTSGKAFAPADCTALVGNAVANLEARIADTGARVEYGALPVVHGDAGQLGQLFQNLIGNALTFTRPNVTPDVRVDAARQGDAWVVQVRDNGIGIAPEYAERVFQMFQRLHTRDEYEGTGIGLSTCKRIVERHGGRIWVESREGQGATFLFTLPTSDVSDARDRSAAAAN